MAEPGKPTRTGLYRIVPFLMYTNWSWPLMWSAIMPPLVWKTNFKNSWACKPGNRAGKMNPMARVIRFGGEGDSKRYCGVARVFHKNGEGNSHKWRGLFVYMARVIRKNGEGNSHISISDVFMIISMMILICCFNHRRLDHLCLKPSCYHNHYIALCVTSLYILSFDVWLIAQAGMLNGNKYSIQNNNYHRAAVNAILRRA